MFRSLKSWTLFRFNPHLILCNHTVIIHALLLTTADTFLGASAKLPKVTTSFVMSAYLSIHLEQLAPPPQTDFHAVRYLSIFRKKKTIQKVQLSLKSDKNNGFFKFIRMYINDKISFTSSKKGICFKVVEESRTHIIFNNLFPKIVPFIRLCGRTW